MIVALPFPTAVTVATVPVAVTDATVGALELHAIVGDAMVAALASVATAVTVRVSPSETMESDDDTDNAMLATVAAGTLVLSLLAPQPLKHSEYNSYHGKWYDG